MWFYDLKTVADGRTKCRWERVRELRRLDDTASRVGKRKPPSTSDSTLVSVGIQSYFNSQREIEP
jgi:hypothetical protein